uniref:WW domain binding protein 11 n=1 Tax=Myripristis murdjan TaxID=586833 RepID=A0A667X123_9TELE
MAGPPPLGPPPAPPMRAGGPPRPLAPPLSIFPPPLNSNVLSAPPSIVQRQKANITSVAAGGGATISAKPQIINPKAEVTRFVPTALRVRRDKSGAVPGAAPGPLEKATAAPMGMTNPAQMGAVSQPNMKTKDQVYEAFMREMEGLL